MTIIILIILAAISINAVLGDRGIIKKAQEAKEMYEKSIRYEEEEMNLLLQEYENTMADPPTPQKPTTGPNGKPLVNKDTITTTDHSKIIGEDEKGNQIVVPKGFKIADDSGSTVQNGIVIEDDEKNQFVWIPVSNINHDGTNKIIKNDGSEVEITLGRYTFNTSTGVETKVQYGSEYAATTAATVAAGTVSQYKVGDYFYELTNMRISNNSDGANGTNTTAKNLQTFIESVRDNHGYYLARYEASHSTTDSTKPASKVADVWARITQPDAAEASRNMYSGNTKIEVESDLCNSYGWDTAIVYIQAMGHSNYANTNCDMTGNTSLIETGTTKDEKCKIFNMADNYYEWTTEYSTCVSSSGAIPCTHRGGYYGFRSARTESRNIYNAKFSGSGASFRVLLYI